MPNKSVQGQLDAINEAITSLWKDFKGVPIMVGEEETEEAQPQTPQGE